MVSKSIWTKVASMVSECKEFYGREKVTKVVKNGILYELSMLRNQIVEIDNYYYPRRFKTINAYFSTERQIDNISEIELKIALRNVLRKSKGYSVKNLIDVTAKVMGFAKTGRKTNEALMNALQSLVTDGNVEIKNDEVYLLKDKISFYKKTV